MCSAETLGNGRQAGQGRQGRSLRREVEAAGHHLESSFVILQPIEGAGGNHISEDLGQDHHREEDDQRVRYLEFAFCHDEFFLRVTNRTVDASRTSRTRRESARAGPSDNYV